MNYTRLFITGSALVHIVLSSFKQSQRSDDRDDFKRLYDKYNVQGSFVLFDQRSEKYTFYNRSQFNTQFSPASTFKICNSLIGLETGVIKDENFIISWDSIVHPNPKLNKDHDLKTAFKNSTVWYYRELARRVGGQQMKYWLDKAQYGNADTSGGIDQFWLNGGLRITPEQQIDFLKRLRNNQLPFSQRSVDIVKKIMIVKDTLGYTLRAKTGWSDEENGIVGWYVGYLEKDNNVYYFANCIQTSDVNNKEFAKARIDITSGILRELGLTE